MRKMSKSEITEITRQYKDILMISGRINTMKMDILPNLLYRLGELPMEIQRTYFMDLKNT